MEETFGSVDCTCRVNTPAASRSPLAEGGAGSADRAGAKSSSAVLNSFGCVRPVARRTPVAIAGAIQGMSAQEGHLLREEYKDWSGFLCPLKSFFLASQIPRNLK